MNTHESMKFEWEHTRDDHVVMIEYQLLHTTQRKWIEAAQRKIRLIVFGLVCIPLGVLYFANLNEQGVITTLASIGVLGFIFWLIVLKKPSARVLQVNAQKLARRYVDQMPTVPTGRYQLAADGTVLEWYWVDGNERNSYPISSVDHLSEGDGRLYVIRNGEVSASVPFHAFADQQTRMDFIKMIEDITERKFDV
jgi:hypothetical protein